MAQLVSLSDQDLTDLRAELAGGKPPMVWFTSAAVGVPAGASAKIVAFADVAEGDYVQVRPTGSKDVLSFSPPELTRTRPPRRKATAKPARPTRAAARAPEPVAAPAKPPPPAPAPAPVPAAVKPAPARPVPAKPAPRRTAARAGSGTAKSAEVVVTLTSTASGEWTVDVMVGKKRAVRNAPVAPAEVATAARALPSAVGDAIEASLATARRQQQARVAALRAELEEAQRALNDLG